MGWRIFLEDLKYDFRFAWKKWARALAQVTVAGSIALGTVVSFRAGEGRRVDHWLLRHFYEFRGPRTAPKEVLLVAIDDESYEHLGASTNFPLPRHFIADALEAIEKAAPGAIILDANVPPQPNMEPEADKRIEAALRAGPTTIWNGVLPPEEPQGSFPTDAPPAVFSSDNRFRNAAKLELPMTVMGEDGLVLFISYGTSPNATLYERVPIAKALVELAHMNVDEPGANDLINFYGPRGTINRMPLYRVLGADQDRLGERLHDKIVLIGYQSVARGRGVSNKDEFDVPVSSLPMFGVEIHGNIVGNLIDHTWLRQPSRETESKAIFLLTFFIAALGMRLSGGKSLAAIVLLSATVISVDYFLFSVKRIWVEGIGSVFLAGFVIVIAVAIYNIWTADRFRRFIDKAFGLSPAKKR